MLRPWCHGWWTLQHLRLIAEPEVGISSTPTPLQLLRILLSLFAEQTGHSVPPTKEVEQVWTLKWLPPSSSPTICLPMWQAIEKDSKTICERMENQRMGRKKKAAMPSEKRSINTNAPLFLNTNQQPHKCWRRTNRSVLEMHSFIQQICIDSTRHSAGPLG